MNKVSKTNWKRLAKMEDKDIDTSDIPELDDAFFQNAEVHVPPKQPVTLRLDTDVLAWFKSEGQGYQTRINKFCGVIWKVSSLTERRAARANSAN